MPHAVQIRQTGGPEVLHWTPIEVGEPGWGQVRLRQAVAGLNYIDVYPRTGHYSQPLPFIPGVEGAGTVEAVGPDVRGRKVGDRVAYDGPIGAYAETRLTPADRLVVFDSVGEDIFLRSLDCLRPRGMMVTFGQTSGVANPIAPILLSQKGSLLLTRPVPRATRCARCHRERAVPQWLRERSASTSISALRSKTPQRPTRHWKRGQTSGSTILTI